MAIDIVKELILIMSNIYNPKFDKYYDNCSVYLDKKYDQYQRICRSEMISLKSLNDKDGIKRGWRNVD